MKFIHSRDIGYRYISILGYLLLTAEDVVKI